MRKTNHILWLVILLTISVTFLVRNETGMAMLFDSPIPGTPTSAPSPTSKAPTPSPKPTSIPAQEKEDVQLLMLSDAVFQRDLSKIEQEELLRYGLPIPITKKVMIPNSLKNEKKQSQRMAASNGNGWEVVYEIDFENDFLHDNGACHWMRQTSQGSRLWGRDTRRSVSWSHAIWPAADPPPAPLYVPAGTRTQLICRLDDMGVFENLMVEFQAWYEFYDPGDWLDVLFSTDGNNFRGIRWRGSNSLVQQDWRRYRIYYPELAAGNAGTVYIMWDFQSLSGRAEGAWLDDLRIERYDQPAHHCQTLNPAFQKSGVPGNHPVSKGLNVDIDTEDPAVVRTQRLHDSQVQWVRLEFKTSDESRDVNYPGLTVHLFPQIDLKKYDEFIDDLCVNGMAVLGLIDGASIRSSSWRQDGRLSPADMAEFTAVSDLLAHYYDDRIRYWEIWNEPDFVESRLRPEEYARLLQTTYQVIKGVDRTDKIVFGGLGSADPNAWDYLVDVYSSQSSVPFDTFALHPYVSTLYRYPDGRLMVHPQDYMLQDEGFGPTIIHKFLNVMNTHGDAFKRIWATELGWNSAIDSPLSAGCNAIREALVPRGSQAHYLTSSFDILFTETGWNVYSPSITKIFWYQYRDTGACIACQTALVASGPTGTQSFSWSPSWNAASANAQCPPERPDLVDWWFGLYQGYFAPKPAESAFREYPQRPLWLPTILRQ